MMLDNLAFERPDWSVPMVLAWIAEREPEVVNQVSEWEKNWGAWFAYVKIVRRRAERTGNDDPWVAWIDHLGDSDVPPDAAEPIEPPLASLPQSELCDVLIDAVRSGRLPCRAARSAGGRPVLVEPTDWWGVQFDFPLGGPAKVVGRLADGTDAFFDPMFAGKEVRAIWSRRTSGPAPTVGARTRCREELVKLMKDGAPRSMTNKDLFAEMSRIIPGLTMRAFEQAKQYAIEATGNEDWRASGPVKYQHRRRPTG